MIQHKFRRLVMHRAYSELALFVCIATITVSMFVTLLIGERSYQDVVEKPAQVTNGLPPLQANKSIGARSYVWAPLASPSECLANQPVRFTLTNYIYFGDVLWSFGDGGRSNRYNPIHEYSTPGYYIVSLYVDLGQHGTTFWDDVIVTDPAEAYCYADFELRGAFLNVKYAITGSSTLFDFTGTYSYLRQNANWSFGNGLSSTSQYNASCVYTSAGNYTVTLTIYSVCNVTSTKAKIVQVLDANADQDGDLLLNGNEMKAHTNPFVADSDLDGIYDGEEVLVGTNPLDPDTDHDGLDDKEENFFGTNPLDADSDHDGFSDITEISAGTNPLSLMDNVVIPKIITLAIIGCVAVLVVVAIAKQRKKNLSIGHIHLAHHASVPVVPSTLNDDADKLVHLSQPMISIRNQIACTAAFVPVMLDMNSEDKRKTRIQANSRRKVPENINEQLDSEVGEYVTPSWKHSLVTKVSRMYVDASFLNRKDSTISEQDDAKVVKYYCLRCTTVRACASRLQKKQQICKVCNMKLHPLKHLGAFLTRESAR